MKGMQKLPFERNRYYYGKMLTSADFRTEQQYMNQKRGFLNRMVLGTGVLCGLTVLNLDDLSILVEGGAAIDSEGREIVVEKSVVQKISAIPGFQEQGVDRFSLCIEYKEENTQPVYAVNRKEDQDEYEYNRIQEGYEFRLMDAKILEETFHLDSEFFVETELFRSRDYRGVLKMPAVACKGWKVRILVEIEKLSRREKTLELAYELQLPSFTTSDGGRVLEIRKTVELRHAGEKQKLDYWIFCLPSELEETGILVKPLGKHQKGAEELELKIQLTEEEPETLIRRELGRPGLEIRESAVNQGAIRLADLYMRHTDTACVIEKVDETVRQYIPLPSGEVEKSLYSSFYAFREWESDKESVIPPVQEAEQEIINKESGIWGMELPEEDQEEKFAEPGIACGTLEIPLDENMKKGTVCYSDEIFHGLGPGNVFVAAGLDEPEEGVRLRRQIPSIIYGDAALFDGQNPLGTCVTTAVKVWAERGSFQVAAKLTGEQNTVLLTMHWIAWRYPEPEESEIFEEPEERWISPEEVTVNLRPGEKHFFAVTFHNMKPCSVMYELMEEHTGKLEEDGTYTAPGKAGVYEIKISCEEFPEICTYTYAVVTR